MKFYAFQTQNSPRQNCCTISAFLGLFNTVNSLGIELVTSQIDICNADCCFTEKPL